MYRADFALVLLPALAWFGAVRARPDIIQPRCARNPMSCTGDGVFALDQFTLGLASPEADRWSFFTQNLSGSIALAGVVAWSGARVLLRHTGAWKAISAAGTDIVILLQTVFWNGIVTELVRLSVQRPRPFVYADPQRFGDVPAHYTSFISGHTSFTAAVSTGLVLALSGRNAPRWLIASAASIALVLTALTGALRVLAGRHFITDVAAGALAGTSIAFLIAWIHRRAGARLAS